MLITTILVAALAVGTDARIVSAKHLHRDLAHRIKKIEPQYDHDIESRGTVTPSLAERGETFSGRGTFYDVGLGACGNWNNPSDNIVALNEGQFDGAGSGWPSPVCGKTITIQGPKGNQVSGVQIQDKCPGCPYGALDLSTGLFNQFDDPSVGVIQLTWWYEDGSGGGGGGGGGDNQGGGGGGGGGAGGGDNQGGDQSNQSGNQGDQGGQAQPSPSQPAPTADPAPTDDPAPAPAAAPSDAEPQPSAASSSAQPSAAPSASVLSVTSSAAASATTTTNPTPSSTVASASPKPSTPAMPTDTGTLSSANVLVIQLGQLVIDMWRNELDIAAWATDVPAVSVPAS